MLMRRNLQKSLPDQLLQRGSDLDVLITEIQEPGMEKMIGFKSAVRHIQHTVAGLCPQYQPSQSHENDCLCRSGEISGQPFRGSKCFDCRVSQFSHGGYFTGEITGPHAGA